MRLFIISVSNFSGRNKKVKWIINVLVIQSFHLHVFDFLNSFFLMTWELKIIFITPQNLGFTFQSVSGEHIMKVNNLISRSITNKYKHGSLIRFDAIINESLNTAIDFFLHCWKEYFIIIFWATNSITLKWRDSCFFMFIKQNLYKKAPKNIKKQ